MKRTSSGRLSVGRLRPLLALLVMLAAVLPHLGLAASLRPIQSHAARHLSEPQTTAPCHEPAGPDHSVPQQSPCCLIGCAMLAEFAVAALPRRTLLWMRTASPAPALPAGIAPEPAEPPPRSAA